MRLPFSLSLFIPQVVILLLQMFPGTGLLLMMLGAPAWAVVLLNAPMLACAVEAAVRPGLRLWLLLPALWFGGYALFVGLDRAGVAWNHRRVETAAATTAPFDPRREALVILGDGSQRVEMDNRAMWFVGHTKAPVVYLQDRTFKAMPYAAMRLAPIEVCQRPKSDQASGKMRELDWSRDNEAGIRKDFLSERTGPYTRDSDRAVCAWSAPEAVDRPITTVTFERRGRTGVEVTIVSVDGRRQVLSGPDEAGPLPWFPLPLLGCGLNDGANKWQCGFRFMHGFGLSLAKGEERAAASNVLAARALGLTLVSTAERRPSDVDVQAVGDRLRDRAAREQLAMLDALLANPRAGVGWTEFHSLAQRPDLLGARLGPAVELVERGAAPPKDPRAYDQARMVFDLLQKLPDKTVAPYRARLDALSVNKDFEPNPWETAWTAAGRPVRTEDR